MKQAFDYMPDIHQHLLMHDVSPHMQPSLLPRSEIMCVLAFKSAEQGPSRKSAW